MGTFTNLPEHSIKQLGLKPNSSAGTTNVTFASRAFHQTTRIESCSDRDRIRTCDPSRAFHQTTRIEPKLGSRYNFN